MVVSSKVLRGLVSSWHLCYNSFTTYLEITMELQLRDIDLETFVAEHALMIHDIRALQLGLLLVSGDSLAQGRILACHGDDILYRAALHELLRVGFLQEKQS